MIKTITAILFFFAISATSLAQSGEQYLVSSKTLNVRSGPGKEFEVVATLSMGDPVTLMEKADNGWWLVEFNGYQGYVFSSMLKADPYSGWQRTNYESGVTPDCENVTPKYEYSLDNYLRINVGSGTDAVVKLMKRGYYGDECIRIVYVRSKESYEIKNVPEGVYYLKIAYGKDYRQKIVDNTCYVKFMRNAQYERGSETLDFNKIKRPDRYVGNEVYENWSVPSFELSLDVIVSKGTKSSFKSNDISEAEFNK